MIRLRCTETDPASVAVGRVIRCEGDAMTPIAIGLLFNDTFVEAPDGRWLCVRVESISDNPYDVLVYLRRTA